MRRPLRSRALLALSVLAFLPGCSASPGTSQALQSGTIKIVNNHARGSDTFPGGRHLPVAREYGVCIVAYPVPAPAGLIRPTLDSILAKDAQQTTYALPAATYTVQEWQTDSEINQDPLYSPAFTTYVRPPEQLVLKADQTIVFGSETERTLPVPGPFAEGNPINGRCGGGAPLQSGTIKIVNNHVRGSDTFPGGRHLPVAREYGVCIVVYPAPAPAGLIPPTFDTILARDAQQTTYGLPAATYTVQEWQMDSEINQDPAYSPLWKTYVRPLELVVLKADQTIVFGSETERTLPVPGPFVEGIPASPDCVQASEPPGGLATPTTHPTSTPSSTPEATPEATPEVTPTATAEAATGVWVLKFIQPDVGKAEGVFNYPGLVCNGGTKVRSSETSATTTTTGTCQVKGAIVANEVTRHTWSRPPDRLTPNEEVTGTMTASQSGLCSWTSATTEEGCRRQVATSHIVWQGDGWPGGPVEFPYQDLVYGNDTAFRALAFDRPTGSFKWTVPDGIYGGHTLVLQFRSTSSGGRVYTNFWYEWQAP